MAFSPSLRRVVEKKVVLPYSTKVTWSVVGDIPAYKGWMPFCAESRALGKDIKVLDMESSPSSGSDVKPVKFDCVIGFSLRSLGLPFHEAIRHQVIAVPHSSVVATAVKNATSYADFLQYDWKFKDVSATDIPVTQSHKAKTKAGDATSSRNGPECKTEIVLRQTVVFKRMLHVPIWDGVSGMVTEAMLRSFQSRMNDLQQKASENLAGDNPSSSSRNERGGDTKE